MSSLPDTADASPATSVPQRAEDLHERALIGGVFYLLSWLLVAGYGGVWAQRPALSALLCAVFVVLMVVRLLVRRWWAGGGAERAAASLRAQWTVLLATAALWGGIAVWAMLDPALAGARTLAMLATSALAMAFAQIFAVNRRIALIGTGLLFLPMFAVVVFGGDEPGTAMVLALNLAYLVAVIGRSHREYEGKLALELQLREQRDRFAAASRTDALTGLANRRHFQHGLDESIAAARSDGSAVAVAFLIADLDHFKSINDRYGHAAGDRCLREVATVLRDCFHDGDMLVARLGGEEFGVLVAGDDAARIGERAEAFRARLAGEHIRLPDGSHFDVTVSVGLAHFSPQRHRDGDALYQAADEALYRAKKAGRNRIEAA